MALATFPASAAAAGVALAGTTESVRSAADCMGGRAIVRDVPGNVARVAGVLPNTQTTLVRKFLNSSTS